MGTQSGAFPDTRAGLPRLRSVHAVHQMSGLYT